jgi:hypothetical protein
LVEKLISLDLRNNDFPTQNLANFSSLVNLKELLIGNNSKEKIEKDIYNHFSGSLDSLKDLINLTSLDISNTDINTGLESLPKNLKKIKYSCELRPESKVKELQEKLNKFSYNIEIKEIRERVEKIPYEKFTNIEYLAEGGYGTVYKANYKDNNNQTSYVALKVLDKFDIDEEEFYREVNNYDIFNYENSNF